MGEDESPRSNPQSYPTHFRCIIDTGNKIKFKPWAIEKSFTQKIRNKPATIRSNNESEFVFEISNEKGNKTLPTIMSLCSPQFHERVEVEILTCNRTNQSHCLIYIHDYNIPDFEDYGSELKEEYNLLDV